jgi:hypothetical protein
VAKRIDCSDLVTHAGQSSALNHLAKLTLIAAMRRGKGVVLTRWVEAHESSGTKNRLWINSNVGQICTRSRALAGPACTTCWCAVAEDKDVRNVLPFNNTGQRIDRASLLVATILDTALSSCACSCEFVRCAGQKR